VVSRLEPWVFSVVSWTGPWELVFWGSDEPHSVEDPIIHHVQY
jgi:hypothetical protein